MAIGNAREFDDWADRYDESVQSEDGFPFRGYHAATNRAVALAGAEPSSRILDLGTGTGNLARRFVDLGCRVWGIDFSQAMLQRARIKVPEARLAQADILGSWPEEFRGRFDRIVSGYVFHHFDLEEKVDLLARLKRDHCEHGGRIVVADISFPTKDALSRARARYADSWDEEHYWVAAEILPACERAGLAVQYEKVDELAAVYVVRTSAAA